MSDRGASGRSRASSAHSSVDLSRPIVRPGSQPPSPAQSLPGARPPSPALHMRTLPPSPASSSSFYGFSDVPAVPPPRPVSHLRPPPAIPPRADQFNYLPLRPTYFRYQSQGAQTPSGFFHARPIVFDQGVQTDPSMRPTDRQGPRSAGPLSANGLKDHQRLPVWDLSRTTLPGYSRAVVAAPRPSPFRPLALPSTKLPVAAPPESPPPRIWNVSPSPSGASLPEAQQTPIPPTVPAGAPRPERPVPPVLAGSEPPPPPYEAAVTWPAQLRFIPPAGTPTTTSSAPSSVADQETPPRNTPPKWPVIPPLPPSSTAAGSSTSADSPAVTTSSAPPPSYAEVVSGAASPGGSSSSGLLGRVTSPPATTTTVPSSSSPLSSQVHLQHFALVLYLMSGFCVRSLCSPILSFFPVYAPIDVFQFLLYFAIYVYFYVSWSFRSFG